MFGVLTVRSESVIGNSRFCALGLLNMMTVAEQTQINALKLVHMEGSKNSAFASTTAAGDHKKHVHKKNKKKQNGLSSTLPYDSNESYPLNNTLANHSCHPYSQAFQQSGSMDDETCNNYELFQYDPHGYHTHDGSRSGFPFGDVYTPLEENMLITEFC